MPEVDNKNASRYGTLFVFFGLIATGKSTLAAAWALRHKFPYYNSDRIRKQIAGLHPEARQKESCDQGIYSREFSQKTYTALLDRAKEELGRSSKAVLDASYQERQERSRVRELADRMGGRVYFILCTCSEEEMKKRMEARARDPKAVSDGRWEIYLKQKQRFEQPTELAANELITINTEAPVADLLEQLERMLALI